MVLFSDASKCTAPDCGPEDVTPTSGIGSVLLLGSGVATDQGALEIEYAIDDLPSLDDSEVHLFLVAHGPPLPGREAEQRSGVGVGEGCNLGPMGNWCPFIAFATAPDTPEANKLECD